MLADFHAMNAAELMDRVFTVYQKSFVKQLAFSVFVSLISLGAMFFAAFVVGMAVAVPAAIGGADEEALVVGIIIAMLAAMLPLYLIWEAAVQSGHMIYARQAFGSQPIRLPMKRLPGIALRVLSAAGAQLVLALPFVAACALAVYLFARPSPAAFSLDGLDAAADFFSSFAWVLVLMAGSLVYLVYSNIFSLAVPVAVFEKRLFLGTVTRSWRLIKGEFWKVLGLRALWAAVIALFSYSAQGVWAAVGAAFTLSPALTAVGGIVTSGAALLVSVALGPLSGIFPALLYFNQRIKREGMDIELGIERLTHERGPL